MKFLCFYFANGNHCRDVSAAIVQFGEQAGFGYKFNIDSMCNSLATFLTKVPHFTFRRMQ